MWKQLFQMDHKWEPGEKRKEHFKNPFKKPYLRLEGFFFFIFEKFGDSHEKWVLKARVH